MLALLQSVVITGLFVYGVNITDRDFLSHSVFFAVYLLQDIMMIIILPNFTYIQGVIIVLLHAALFLLTWLISSTSKTGDMVPFMSIKCVKCVF